MSRRRFHRISHPENNTFHSFNPERIESVLMHPHSDENDQFVITVVMGSGTKHVIYKPTVDAALEIFCSLSNSPPPTTSFDDVRKSYFPST